MELSKMHLKEFTRELASDSPAPGGGSVAALCGALGAALSEMVTSLTIGKEKYRDVWDEMGKVQKEAKELQERFYSLMDQDAEAFNTFFAALKMPKETDEEKALRTAKMQEGLKEAAIVPLETLTACQLLAGLAEIATLRGNGNAVTDAGTAALLARAAAKAAAYNVRINLGGIKDEGFVAKTKAEVDQAMERVEKTVADVERHIETLL
jgi:glutamate formiminotransferase/formiminotetrahydrofolate cyclodeaminase